MNTFENLALYDMHLQSEMYLMTSLERTAIGVVTCAMKFNVMNQNWNQCDPGLDSETQQNFLATA